MNQSVLKIYTDYTACMFIDGTFVSEIEKNTFLRIPLKKGVYEIKIVPVDFSNLADTRIYIMPENNIEDLIRVYFANKIYSLLRLKYLDIRRNKHNCLELYNSQTGEVILKYPQSITYVGEFNAEGFAPIMEGGVLLLMMVWNMRQEAVGDLLIGKVLFAFQLSIVILMNIRFIIIANSSYKKMVYLEC